MTRDEVNRLLRYDPLTGAITWRVSPRANVAAGAEAGRITSGGYRQITIMRKGYLAHRVAWLLAGCMATTLAYLILNHSVYLCDGAEA